MTPPEEAQTPVAQVGEDLFNFAIDREDTKWLVARLPAAAEVQPATVEYELQILKIISVGWSIAYFMEEWPQRKSLEASFWKAVQTFAQGLSTTTGLMIGRDVDYFQILKDRLAAYVEALRRHPGADHPADVIGPEFAGLCGNREDLFAVVTGGRMFGETTRRVRDYLQALDLEEASGPGDAPLH